MGIFSIFIFAIVMLLGAGCGTPTPYQKAGEGTGRDSSRVGYSEHLESRGDGAVYRIQYDANADTPDSLIRAYWRKRAAELCASPVANSSDAEIKRWIENIRVSEYGPNAQGEEKCRTVDCWQVNTSSRYTGGQTQSQTTDLRSGRPAPTVEKRPEITTTKSIQGYVYCPNK